MDTAGELYLLEATCRTLAQITAPSSGCAGETSMTAGSRRLRVNRNQCVCGLRRRELEHEVFNGDAEGLRTRRRMLVKHAQLVHEELKLLRAEFAVSCVA